MSYMEESNVEEKKSNRPPISKFHQQRLPAWQPMFTAGKVFPYFVIVGLIMVGLGILFFLTSNAVQEFEYVYTDCLQVNSSATCASVVGGQFNSSNPYPTCQCQINFALSSDFIAPIYLFYGMTNFYQNHRLYLISRDDNQLMGNVADLASACSPFISTSGNVAGPEKYAPCGSVANSLFNDSFTLMQSGSSTPVVMSNKGISWASDTSIKFGVVSDWSPYVKPVNWPIPEQNRSSNAYMGDEELQVWMRPAALPSFRKLNRIISTNLPQGNYTININYNYPVKAFAGTKSFVLSTSSWLGGRNIRLGIAYLVVGCVHVVIGLVFLVLHFKLKHLPVSITTASD